MKKIILLSIITVSLFADINCSKPRTISKGTGVENFCRRLSVLVSAEATDNYRDNTNIAWTKTKGDAFDDVFEVLLEKTEKCYNDCVKVNVKY